jgi:hypothetical protein
MIIVGLAMVLWVLLLALWLVGIIPSTTERTIPQTRNTEHFY